MLAGLDRDSTRANLKQRLLPRKCESGSCFPDTYCSHVTTHVTVPVTVQLFSHRKQGDSTESKESNLNLWRAAVPLLSSSESTLRRSRPCLGLLAGQQAVFACLSRLSRRPADTSASHVGQICAFLQKTRAKQTKRPSPSGIMS